MGNFPVSRDISSLILNIHGLGKTDRIGAALLSCMGSDSEMRILSVFASRAPQVDPWLRVIEFNGFP